MSATWTHADTVPAFWAWWKHQQETNPDSPSLVYEAFEAGAEWALGWLGEQSANKQESITEQTERSKPR